MLIKINLILCLVFNIVVYNEGARILVVIPTPSISHQVVFRPLTQELAKRGHEVVVLTTDPVFPKGGAPTNLTEIDVHDVSYARWETFVKSVKGNKNDLYSQLTLGFDNLEYVFEKQIESPQVQKLIQDKSQHFDLLMIEACIRPALVFSHLYNVPTVFVSSLGFIFDSYKSIGIPMHLFLYPPTTSQKLNNLTLWDKLSELYTQLSLEYLYSSHEESENKMLRKHFGPDVPPLSELRNNIDMIFLNVHPIWENNRPVPPGVIYMGGMHQKPRKVLPKDLKSYLDSSKNGVIYMSFGTNTKPSLLPSEKIQAIVKVFSKLHYDILWKWDQDELPGRSNNIKISKWFPQSDLLQHPKVKLFITQGGLQSTDEALTAGVPLIGIPMLGDQWYNVEQYVKHKIGLRLDMQHLTEDNFKDAITTVIEDKSFRKNVERLRLLMRDEPQSALERAVWWTEYVLRHGGTRHLRAPAANMSWAQYLELEFVSVLLTGMLAVIGVVGAVLYYLVNLVKKKFIYVVKVKRT